MLAAMKSHLSLTFLACVLALPLFGSVSCIDTDNGETGHYSTPCSDLRFRDILLCAAETGAAAPVEDEVTPVLEDRPYTCAHACQDFMVCGLISPDDLEACIMGCLTDPLIDQTVLDCIRDNGCNSVSCF